jgi:hypothetical protein
MRLPGSTLAADPSVKIDSRRSNLLRERVSIRDWPSRSAKWIRRREADQRAGVRHVRLESACIAALDRVVHAV